MIHPPIPKNEAARLAAVQEYNLLDTLPEKDFDNITSLAATICEVPIALVTLLETDRNFLKSHFGVPINESPREISFCGHAILDTSDIFVVEDARKDERFHDNPLVTEQQAIFYAGVPLRNKEGLALGTLCIFDTKPQVLSETKKKALVSLAYQVMNLFEQRKRNKELEQLKIQLENQNEDLKNFAGTVSHDMKMPLSNIIVTADILKAKYASRLDAQALEYLNYLKDSSFSLSDYISGLLSHYASDVLAEPSEEVFSLNHLLEDIVELLDITHQCEINFPDIDLDLACNRAALEQIYLNLIGNSLKYNDKEIIKIDIDCWVEGDLVYHKIQDNGIGIPQDKIDTIFDLFSIVGNLDRKGKKGNGIGLSTVRKLVTKLGGTIEVSSEFGKGTLFEFSIRK